MPFLQELSFQGFSTTRLAVVGIPLDENSSYMDGARLGPDSLRAALHSGESNMSTESEVDLSKHISWLDVGNLELTSGEKAITEITQDIALLLEKDVKILSLGGDHSITYPIVKAYAQRYPKLTILHLDAHSDLYDDFDDNPYSHASPFARIMEAKLAERLVQVGVRAMNPHQREQARRFDVEVVAMKDWQGKLNKRFNNPVYLSLDLDVLDPAFAPGVSHHEPGGFSTREVISILQNLKANIVGADIVELNPERDRDGMTAVVAAKLLKELMIKML
ncbi:agmatinase [Microscilla marina]|uniref:Agmatinase, putative n=1 Tax=Microscilla marina ATCC 23134 TaxID=313606 RepID=A1ZJF0_MICM2|nr:agmatinase [Microscilla marina]EAY29686.1 agmatinase, putative [Microscilla marina ATCC 23134]